MLIIKNSLFFSFLFLFVSLLLIQHYSFTYNINKYTIIQKETFWKLKDTVRKTKKVEDGPFSIKKE